jgi:hypothetical protein
VYLRYNANRQGGHELLHLQTNKIIIRRDITSVPITPAVIKQVQLLAQQEKMPSGLKVTNKTGQVLYDSSWISGVDYQDLTPIPFNEDTDRVAEINENDNEEDVNEMSDEYDEMDPNDINDDPLIISSRPNPIAVEEVEQDELNGNINPEQADDGVVDQADDVSQGSDDNEEPLEPATIHTRYGRESRRPAIYDDYVSHLQTQTIDPQEYTLTVAQVAAKVMNFMNIRFNAQVETANQFVQTYSLRKGLKVFKDKGHAAALGEVGQLHHRSVFEPINIANLTPDEKRHAMESLIFLTEKRSGEVKARMCANGSIQRAYISKEDASSPTAMTESILLTAAIDAKQKRDVMTADVPNAFVQTEIDRGGVRIIMKIRGPLVDMLLEIDQTTYQDYVVYENGKKVLYVRMLKALYGMLVSSLLYYKKFKKDIESIGFQINPYDPCVANRVVNGKQQTVTWHVDDLKSSHEDPKVNDKFLEWLQQMYGNDGIAKVKAVRGPRHDYLAMILDFSVPGSV